MSTDSETPHASEPVANGLQLFPPGTDPGKRRRRLIFVAICFAITACLIWPIYPLFSGVQPLILGLPLSFAWVVMDLALIFVALLWLYKSEDPDPSEDS